jgi:hypothetical protein
MSKAWLALPVVLLLVLLAWLLRGGEARAVAGTEEGAAAVTAVPAPEAAATNAPVAEQQREQVAAEPSADAAAPATAVLRGRFVDAQGNAVPSVPLTFWGNARSDQIAETWRKQHGSLPEDVRREFTSGADGRFEFTFTPWPPQHFFVDFHKRGLVSGNAQWPSVAPAAVVDLGDIMLTAGGGLHGRVVEADGSPAAKTSLSFRPRHDARAARATIRLFASGGGQTDADGRFTFDDLLLGDYVIDVNGRDIRSGAEVSLTATSLTPAIEIVLVAEDPKSIITGIVVDDGGQPVGNATVECRGVNYSSTYTGRSGRFVLRTRDGRGDGPLACHAEGYDDVQTAEPVPWGTRDLRLVLRAGLAIEVTVVDAAGQPVIDYSVRVYGKPSTVSRWSSRDFEVRARGDRNGQARTKGVRRGEQVVVIDPGDSSLGGPVFTAVTVADPGPVRLSMHLPALGERRVRVQFADGTPVPACRLQLLDGVEGPVTAESHALAFERWTTMMGGPPGAKALLVAEVKTDAQGEALLRARGDHPLSLLLPGPGHLPKLLDGVTLAGDPLLVTVSRGAVLTGKVTPPEVMAELRRLAELPTSGPFEPGRSHVPSLELVREEAPQRWVRFPNSGAEPQRLGADGSFRIDGVPPGTWNFSLSYMVLRNGGGSGHSHSLPPVTLRDGETTTVDLDLRVLLPGTLQGSVLRNGVPLAHATVMLVGKTENGQEFYDQAETDDDGRLTAAVRSGSWKVRLQRHEPTRITEVSALGAAVVTAGAVTTETFTIASGEVKVRLLDGDGKTVNLVPMLSSASTEYCWIEPVDREGWHVAQVDADTWTVRVLPQRLLTQEAQQALMVANPGNPDALKAAMLVLGTFTLGPGEVVERELRLPAEWSR